MYPAPGKCPVCNGLLYVERLSCEQCGTAIEGTFTLQRFLQLSAEQWGFVELFLRCEGKLNRVQEELKISYPTVRNRLHEVMAALGYEPRSVVEADVEDRRAVLDSLSQGEIDVDAAIKLLKGGRG